MTTNNVMESLESTNNAGRQDGIALQSLVNHLVAGIVPAVVKRKSFVINDIPPGLRVAANHEMIAAVLGKLFTAIATHTESSCIRVTSREYGYLVVVQLRNNNNISPYTIADSLQETIPLAEKIGGYIGVSSHDQDQLTIVFSFPNVPVAA